MMRKSEFLEKIKTMDHPIIKEFCPGDVLLSKCWVVEDIKNARNKFCVPTIRLSRREYMNGDLSNYYQREQIAREKYKRWLNESIYDGT